MAYGHVISDDQREEIRAKLEGTLKKGRGNQIVRSFRQVLGLSIGSKENAIRIGSSYLGTKKPFVPVATAQSRKAIKSWVRSHKDLTQNEYNLLLKTLSLGKTSNEFSAIGELLQLIPHLRRNLKPRQIVPWLARAEGWAEVDSICQSKFGGEELLDSWQSWSKTLDVLSESRNVHKRRASLVLLTKPVRDSFGADPRLASTAFKNIDRLKNERDILITKAVSWLLRDLIKHHRKKVEIYLNNNEQTLAPIALRETRNKLRSGKKSG